VPVLDIPVTIADLADLDLVAAVIALQRPLWEPGTRHGYHGITLGWYESELLRRVDPARRSIGRFFAEEIAAPLGIEFYIGLPDEFDFDRCPRIIGRNKYKGLLHLGKVPRGPSWCTAEPEEPVHPLVQPAARVDTNYNNREVLAVEIPAGNGIGEPRAVAAAYGAAVTGGLRLASETLAALVQPAQPPSGGLFDLVLRVEPTVFSLGYLKPAPDYSYGGSADAAFGTPGNGGSFGFGDPETRIGYCYAPNRLGWGFPMDEREIAIRQALYRYVLGERSQRPSSGGHRRGGNGAGAH